MELKNVVTQNAQLKNQNSPVRRIMLIAGEASGDTLGAELVKALQQRVASHDTPGRLEFFGAGGPRMESVGVKLAFDLTGHAVVGIWEVLKNYSKFKSFFDQLLAAALEGKPHVIILIDYPGFNLRFAKAIKERFREQGSDGWSAKIVYYVSPQIWAWHESRVHQIARDVDLLLSIFPFEKDWFAKRRPDLRVEFVGHPLFDRYPDFSPHPALLAPRRDPLILLLPGSRIREIKKHLPVMAEAAKQIAAEIPTARFRMVLPAQPLVGIAEPLIAGLPRLEVATAGLAAALAEAQLAIASSGTVTMECAFFRVPTVVLYKTSWSTYELGRRFINVKYIAMPNLLADELIYPEFIQNAATSANLCRAALDLLRNQARIDSMRLRLTRVIDSLGGPGASDRAATAVLSVMS